jgi:hypothetical protein
MPWTEEEKQAEKERVTKISGFRVAAQDLLAEIDPDALKARNDRWEAKHGKMTRQERAEIDPDALKARNDRWEAKHGKMTRQERMEEELQRAMV